MSCSKKRLNCSIPRPPFLCHAINEKTQNNVFCLSGPWCRLPLTVRWLRPELKGNVDFLPDRPPPMHMPIVYGQVKSVSLKKKKGKKKNKNDITNPEVWFCRVLKWGSDYRMPIIRIHLNCDRFFEHFIQCFSLWVSKSFEYWTYRVWILSHCSKSG